MSREPKSSSPAESADDSALTREATRWVLRRDRGLTAAEQRALLLWRRADSRHEAAWEQVASTWRSLDGMEADPVLADTADAIYARARRRQARRRAVRWGVGTLAAAVAVMVFYWGGGGPEVSPPAETPAANYQVLASDARRLPLPDGSVAELHGQSEIALDFTAAERRVQLVRGEAHFIVEKDAARPFLVSAGPLTVYAVGTAFNVRLEAGAVEVLVTQGKVRLEGVALDPAGGSTPEGTVVPEAAEPPTLTAGQRAVAEVSHRGGSSLAIGTPERAEVEQALAWQSTRLAFNRTPLDDVVRAFNRYNTHQLILGDSSLRTRTLTGVFRADRLEAFVRLLRVSVDVRAEPRGEHETVLLPAP